MDPLSKPRRLDETNLIPNLGTSNRSSSLVSHMKPRSNPQQHSRQTHQKPPCPPSTTPSLPAISLKQLPKTKSSGGIARSMGVSAFDDSKTLVAITPHTRVNGRTSLLHEVVEATVSSSVSGTPLVPGYYTPDTAGNPTNTLLAALIAYLCSPSGVNFPTWSCIEEFADNNIDWIFPACDLLIVLMTLDMLSQISEVHFVICLAALLHFAFFGARLVFYKHFSRQARAGKKDDRYYHSDALTGMEASNARQRDALGRIIRPFGTSPVDAEEGWDAQAITDWESRRQLRATSGLNQRSTSSTSPNPSQEVVEEVIIRETRAPPPVSPLVAFLPAPINNSRSPRLSNVCGSTTPEAPCLLSV